MLWPIEPWRIGRDVEVVQPQRCNEPARVVLEIQLAGPLTPTPWSECSLAAIYSLLRITKAILVLLPIVYTYDL